MATNLPKYLHFVARHVDGQWVVACLDFDLAAQDETFEAAERRLFDQVASYVEEAITLDGGVHAEQLLSRRAPLGDWMLFHLGMLLQNLHAAGGLLRGYQGPSPYQTA